MLKHSSRKTLSFPNSVLVFLAVALVVGGSVAYREFFTSQTADPTLIGSLEYGVPECINGSLWLVFFNPGDFPVENISVFSGDIVYATLKSIEPDSPEAFAIGPCDSVDISGLMLGYCAGVCTAEPLNPEGNPPETKE